MAQRLQSFTTRYSKPPYVEDAMGLILLIILIVLLLGAVPTWPYSRQWGYYPSGGLGLLLLILIVLMLAHVVNWGY